MGPPVIAPLFVAALGRSGTTATLRLLAAHPGIVAHAAYPLELRVFTAAVHPEDETLRAATAGFAEAAPFDAGQQARLAAGEALTGADAEGVYRRITEADGKPDARFAAEKYPPRLDLPTALDRRPDARALILVRDPRDVIVSARAFDAKRGYRGFLEREGDTDEALVERYAGLYARLAGWRRARPDLPLLRYEDLIADPLATAGPLFAALGVAADAGTVAATVAKAGAQKPGRHLTSASVPDSVGRWRAALSPRLADLVADRMAAELAAFGYAD